MMTYRRWFPMAAVLLFVASAASGQGSAVDPVEVTAFMGTWVIDMTEPAAIKGTQTVRIWEKNGAVAASLQTGNSPAQDVTGILKDGDMLVLTISHKARLPMLENGAPIWVVISLTLDRDAMKVAQMLERSQTIKRGTGLRVF